VDSADISTFNSRRQRPIAVLAPSSLSASLRGRKPTRDSRPGNYRLVSGWRSDTYRRPSISPLFTNGQRRQLAGSSSSDLPVGIPSTGREVMTWKRASGSQLSGISCDGLILLLIKTALRVSIYLFI
jgi:hypothetical protein